LDLVSLLASHPRIAYTEDMKAMTYGSLFSGVGGFDLGLERSGMECAWQVEIDEQCGAVLEDHWAGVKRYGDITEVRGSELGGVDLVCGGFPCQDLSVAGRRAGLAGARSGLFHEFMRIVDEVSPRWVLIENVPGLLSSNEGRDMLTVVSEMGSLGYGWSYRILDAQYFGLAQRRKRVFIIGCLGDGRSAAEVLLEPESLCGDPAPSRETGARVAATITRGFGDRGVDADQIANGNCVVEDVASPLTKSFAKHHGASGGKDSYPHNLVAHALTGRHDSSEDGTGRGTPIIGTFEQNSMAGRGTLGYDEDAKVSKPVKPQSDHQMLVEKRREGFTPSGYGEYVRGCGTLRKAGGDVGPGSDVPITSNDVKAVAQNQRGEVRTSDVHPQLTCGGGKPGEGYPCVAFQSKQSSTSQGPSFDEVPPSLDVAKAGGMSTQIGMTVRRLTPVECCRLQGFPDTWLDVEYKGKPLSDSARYRMLGNAVAVPVARWIGERILASHRRLPYTGDGG